jgi:hypothetical protein
MGNNWERFRAAVSTLAGAGSLKQRLADAFEMHLGEVYPEELPRDARNDFSELSASMRNSPSNGARSPVLASVLKMSEPEAVRHAQTIVTIFASLNDSGPGVAAGRTSTHLRAVIADPELPAFLNRA